MRKAYLPAILLLFIIISLWVEQGCTGKKNKGPENAFEFKQRLSEYGFFRGKISALEPENGILPYELSSPLFTDYTVKDRFIVLPKGKSIQYTAQGALNFPDSTIIIKNFAYLNTSHKKVMIETRLLVKDEKDKNWKVMNYLWNKDQTDALKHITGAKLPITLLDNKGNRISTAYQVPNTNDCKRCHIKNSELIPIGPKARNLNITLPGKKKSQLEEWAAKGLLTGLPAPDQLAKLPDWADAKHYTLTQRARAYLDINCAHCHTKGGDAYNTGLFLEYEQTDPSHLGIHKAPVSAGGGAGGLNYDIIPGDALHSILVYRMNSSEPGTAMPELARTVIHKEGVQLIRSWVNSLSAKP